jgi:hypothetical protein
MGRYQRQLAEVGMGESGGGFAPTIVTAAATLKLHEQNVRVDSTAGAFALTLPPVGDAIGLMFTVAMIVDNGNVTVQDQDESYGWSDMVLTAVADHVCVYSDGLVWHQLCDVTT